MAKRRKVGNLMALAILSVVAHRSMHPYEMAAALRGWGKGEDMKIKWGSLYAVVQNLAKHGLLAEAGTSQEGRRPPRTVYRITDAGRAELVDWARELLCEVGSEFRAGLSVMVVLPPDQVVELLQQRIIGLAGELTRRREALAAAAVEVPRLFLVEDEYDLAALAAEHEWVTALHRELIDGTFPGLAQWRDFHVHGEVPADMRELAERGIERGRQ
ncbi:PadR family transcriptional regulator [Natronosporangium hydrolyticum]|uniref:PadR family transcriptional regulator n=1 Tax=Natronosporangium hydrolyticum TaxID=2811111 RepID=A0A895YPQ8_9ACTN|nr:PadR family transcriptional regulator [Natronosporangium hydrolyticum]